MKRLAGFLLLAAALAAPVFADQFISGGGSGSATPSGSAGGDLAGTYPNPTIGANSVALGTDTTGNYAAGDAEGGAATSGDSATSFFGAGQLEAARGGTGQDSSGQTGVPFINAGSWSFGTIPQAYVEDLPETISLLAAGSQSGNVGSYLASGCGVALRATTAYTYDVAACSYVIQSVSYTAAADDVTLAAADATNDRIDSVIVDDQGVISVATGTAAANPLEPSLDPATQLRLASIYVTHNTTAPVGATNEPIFTEGVEWTPSAGTGWSASDTANPHGGTKDLKATGVAAGTYTTFTRGTSIDPTTYQQLNLWIAPVTWGTKRSVELQFLNANGSQVGSALVVANNSYGFSISNTAYQLVAVPVSQFAIPAGATVKALRIYAQGTGGTFTFYVDDVSLQATTNTTATGGLTQAQTDARYVQPAGTSTLTNKTIDAEATGNVITTVAKWWMPVAACQNTTAGLLWDSPTSNAASATCVTGTNTQKGVADFDASTDESLQNTLRLPDDWTGAIDAKVVWYAAATSGAAGLCVQLVCVADAETDDPAFPAQASGNCVSDTAKGTTNQTNVGTITGVTASSCAAGELMHVQLSRDANGGAVTDDMTGDARVIGLELSVRRAQ